MTPELITALGWSAAALFGALHVRTRSRLVLIARATHELRGPLSAARLGLGTLTTEPGRVAAIDLELARAGRALEDLTAAPSGGRRPEHVQPIDLVALTRAYAPAWTTLAESHGATFTLENDPSTRMAGAGDAAGRRALGAVGGDETARWPANGEGEPGRGPAAGRDAREQRPPGSRDRVFGAVSGSDRGLGAVAADDRGFGAVAPDKRGPGDDVAGRRRHLAVVAAPPLERISRRRRWPRLAAAADLATPSPWPDPIPPSHRWTWRPPGTAVVVADPFRVAQAVANLVSNAAEHGGGSVRVRVRRTNGRVWVEVADDGPGLPAPVASLVAEARGRRGRRGHGLAIATAIAEQLGGRIASLPARAGARLVLDLPAAP